MSTSYKKDRMVTHKAEGLGGTRHVPRANIVLHHELMNSLRWVRHIDLALSIFKIGLRSIEGSLLR